MKIADLTKILIDTENQINTEFSAYPTTKKFHAGNLASCIRRINNLAAEEKDFNGFIMHVHHILQGVSLLRPIKFPQLKMVCESLATAQIKLSLQEEMRAKVSASISDASRGISMRIGSQS